MPALCRLLIMVGSLIKCVFGNALIQQPSLFEIIYGLTNREIDSDGTPVMLIDHVTLSKRQGGNDNDHLAVCSFIKYSIRRNILKIILMPHWLT